MKKYLLPYIGLVVTVLIFIPLPNIITIALFTSLLGSIALLDIPSWLKPKTVPLMPMNEKSHNSRMTLYTTLACVSGALLLFVPLPNITTILLFLVFVSSTCTVSIGLKNMINSAFTKSNDKIQTFWKKDGAPEQKLELNHSNDFTANPSKGVETSKDPIPPKGHSPEPTGNTAAETRTAQKK